MYHRLLILLFIMVLPSLGKAEEQLITLSSETEIPINRFQAAGDRILWLPSEYGFNSGREFTLGESLAKAGLDVWVADLHSGYFLPPGRNSLKEMPLDELAELIKISQPEQGRLFIMSTGRGAALTLMAVRRWQQQYPERTPLGGLFLFHANLLAKAPIPGETPSYLPVTRLTNQPILLVQPGDSSKRWYTDELLASLRTGGAEVFTRIIPQVSDGFLLRPDATENEIRETAHIPTLIASSTRLLSGLNPATQTPVNMDAIADSKEWDSSAFGGSLQSFSGDPIAPPLKLTDITGNKYQLDNYQGQVVLLNFWATWCPPCVEEIPSIGRLKTKMTGKPFQVLSVDVGEEKARVEAFLKRIPADFPVLLDPDGTTVSQWKIRAFPTTFLLDTEGSIRYAYFGGLEWDNPEIIAIIEGLLQEKD